MKGGYSYHGHVCFFTTHTIYRHGIHSNLVYIIALIATAFTALDKCCLHRVMCILALYFLIENLFLLSGFDHHSLGLKGMWLNFLTIFCLFVFWQESIFLSVSSGLPENQSFWVMFAFVYFICFRKKSLWLAICKVSYIWVYWSHLPFSFFPSLLLPFKCL